MGLGPGDERVREERRDMDRWKDKLETLMEKKTVNLECLMLNTGSASLAIRNAPLISCMQFLFRTRPA